MNKPTCEQLIEQLGDNLDITICSDIVYGLGYEYQQLELENQKLRDEIMELQEYKKAVYEINKYINAYSPYFLETQEQNNQTIATIIHNIGDYNND